jgi:hypothetical protein
LESIHQLKTNKMKKQITIVLAAFASFYFISCQKEAINPLEESSNSIAASANQENKMSEQGVPFKGSYNTSFVLLQPPPNMIQVVSGEGIASHLGVSTFEATSYVTVSFPPPFTVTGTRIITAANGDQIFTTFSGFSTPAVNGVNGADLQETITGGTGRFANASGSFTTRARNDANISSFKAYFDGYIKY